jgi:hypothetical protein
MRETPKLASERTALLRGMARIFGFRVDIVETHDNRWFYEIIWLSRLYGQQSVTKSFTAAKEFLVFCHRGDRNDGNDERWGSWRAYKRELRGEERREK